MYAASFCVESTTTCTISSFSRRGAPFRSSRSGTLAAAIHQTYDQPPNTAMKPTPLAGSRRPAGAAYRARWADHPEDLTRWHSQWSAERRMGPPRPPGIRYCQYCGKDGSSEWFWRESTQVLLGADLQIGSDSCVATIEFRAGPYYACVDAHFEILLNQEGLLIGSDVEGPHEAAIAQFEAAGLRPRKSTRSNLGNVGYRSARAEEYERWRVLDRYCWQCGGHLAVVRADTRCPSCGELQRNRALLHKVDRR
jgi:hypothetical protein